MRSSGRPKACTCLGPPGTPSHGKRRPCLKRHLATGPQWVQWLATWDPPWTFHGRPGPHRMLRRCIIHSRCLGQQVGAEPWTSTRVSQAAPEMLALGTAPGTAFTARRQDFSGTAAACAAQGISYLPSMAEAAGGPQGSAASTWLGRDVCALHQELSRRAAARVRRAAGHAAMKRPIDVEAVTDCAHSSVEAVLVTMDAAVEGCSAPS